MEAKKADLSKQRIGHSRAEAVRLFPHLVLDQYKSCTKPPHASKPPKVSTDACRCMSPHFKDTEM